jgi:hypothetical protein
MMSSNLILKCSASGGGRGSKVILTVKIKTTIIHVFSIFRKCFWGHMGAEISAETYGELPFGIQNLDMKIVDQQN